jgi:cell wall-associated NlpC family hydrolase
MTAWYEKYLGKPWVAVPNPPESYTCGELVRAVYRDRLGIYMAAILADPMCLRECVQAMTPDRYGLRPLTQEEHPQEYDVVFFRRAKREDHVGIAVQTADGLMIMHCQQYAGVTLDSPAELLGMGMARSLHWFRHKEYKGEICR